MYEYAELREKALSSTSTAEDRLALFNWMQDYALSYWNGEYFDIDEGLRLYPVYNILEETEEGDIIDLELVDAEIR